MKTTEKPGLYYLRCFDTKKPSVLTEGFLMYSTPVVKTRRPHIRPDYQLNKQFFLQP